MRTFKLIKRYPSLPDLAMYAIHNNSTESFSFGRWRIVNENKNITLCYENDVDKFPEFWKEVKEETYKVLSLKYNTYIYRLDKSDGLYKCEEGSISMKSNGGFYTLHNCVIYSIQRLSDSEVFTIGDDTEFGLITGIALQNDTPFVYTKISCFPLSCVKKVKTPKFITEDGVSMFVGNKYCYICNNEVMNSVVKDSSYIPLKNYYFSTREKAEEYLIKNRPLFSLNDILNMGKNLSIPDTCMIYKKELCEFAKQKLNL